VYIGSGKYVKEVDEKAEGTRGMRYSLSIGLDIYIFTFT